MNSMKRQFAAATAALLISGCASSSGPIGQNERGDTLNERSPRFAHSEDRLPPDPNRPPDNRELKAVPTVIQHDPALNKPQEPREDKGLSVNAGADQLVRPQDPTQTPEAPKAAGGPAGQSKGATVTSADTFLAERVNVAIAKARKSGTNIANADSTTTTTSNASKETQGEAKALPGIEVTAKNGVVTLNGSVATDEERGAFEQAASRVPGVTSVNNYLTVSKNKQ